MTTLTVLLAVTSLALVVAAAVVALHLWNRHRWDPETARLKAKGLPWIVLLILAVPVLFWVACSVGARFGHRSGVVGLLIVLLVGGFSRRIGAAKKW